MRDLILLHGALGASSEFDNLAPLLTDHFNVYQFDLTGHGKNSSEKSFSMDQFADDLKKYVEENGLIKPQLFGYSMGGYVGYTLAIIHPEILGDIMSLGTKLKWDPLIAKLETGKLDPDKIMEKVPKFGDYLNSIHLDWKSTMAKTRDLMNDLGNGAALTFNDFAKIQNRCYVGLSDQDEMVSCSETLDVQQAIPNSEFYTLPNSRHPLPQLDKQVLANKIIEFLG
ncbi:MAG: alpha/beta hydrolase [Crocinitomicaceae bacterium]|nr:alpha/beta hydrolase [Crocinitomicaceae bacterium]